MGMVWGGAPLYDRGMITELGHFALILAFGVAIVQMVVPLIGALMSERLASGLGRLVEKNHPPSVALG